MCLHLLQGGQLVGAQPKHARSNVEQQALPGTSNSLIYENGTDEFIADELLRSYMSLLENHVVQDNMVPISSYMSLLEL
jgi:hypothetical protein